MPSKLLQKHISSALSLLWLFSLSLHRASHAAERRCKARRSCSPPARRPIPPQSLAFLIVLKPKERANRTCSRRC